MQHRVFFFRTISYLWELNMVNVYIWLWENIERFSFWKEIVCTPGCWNGGICEAKNICTCAVGYEGDRCERSTFVFVLTNLNSILAVCNETCLYGICTVPYQCTCYPGWNGSSCDQRKNNLYFRNRYMKCFLFSNLHICMYQR